MTKDDLIRIAIQCNLVTTSTRDGFYIDALERFANLVCAKNEESKINITKKEIELLLDAEFALEKLVDYCNNLSRCSDETIAAEAALERLYKERKKPIYEK